MWPPVNPISLSISGGPIIFTSTLLRSVIICQNHKTKDI
jgi:hypothetical protein